MFRPANALLKVLSCGFAQCSCCSSQANWDTRDVIVGTTARPAVANVLSQYPKQLNGIRNHKCFTPMSLGESPHGLPLECQFKFPSVTTILDGTMDSESRRRLERWQQQQIALLGEAGFDSMMDEKISAGTELHLAIENYLKDSSRSLDEAEKDLAANAIPFWTSVLPILRELNKKDVVLTEVFVTHWKLCYKGKVDAVLKYRDRIFLFDWKTATGKKVRAASKANPLAAMYDSPVQMAAYAGAVNADRKYSSVIRNGALILCKDTGKPADVIEMSQKDLEVYWILWLSRVSRFWKRMNASSGPTVSFIQNDESMESWSDDAFECSSHDKAVSRMLM